MFKPEQGEDLLRTYINAYSKPCDHLATRACIQCRYERLESYADVADVFIAETLAHHGPGKCVER